MPAFISTDLTLVSISSAIDYTYLHINNRLHILHILHVHILHVHILHVHILHVHILHVHILHVHILHVHILHVFAH
jgi:hypothetical protein